MGGFPDLSELALRYAPLKYPTRLLRFFQKQSTIPILGFLLNVCKTLGIPPRSVMSVSILREQIAISLSSIAEIVDTRLTRILMLLEMSLMTISSPLPKGRRSRGQPIPRMFQEILFPSYKPHPKSGCGS
jgi:hypothetical protein